MDSQSPQTKGTTGDAEKSGYNVTKQATAQTSSKHT